MGAPIAMSTPHFLDANAEQTGIILQASKKIQVNLILKRVNGISSMSRVPEMLLHLVWADECASLDAESKGKFQSAFFYLWLARFQFRKWVLLAHCPHRFAPAYNKKTSPKRGVVTPLFMSQNRKAAMFKWYQRL
ncbi:Sensory neuron membrane protein 1 [Orchesella cincta]|uniref:Sensory neuron membrane protein 1 n=1 Tax=Orchesella cincta TaxID=48709 RepID=A0A1D2M5A8_ORCCI|nr:Sensory neuron membrane protein 1 [Orchesella cincta]